MRSAGKFLMWMTAAILTASIAHGATVTGTVKGPDGAAFKGAFAQAQNTKTRITVNVLTGQDGRYRFDSLPAGEYNLRIHAVGYRSDPHNAVVLTEKQKVSFDWALQTAPVRWTDLSFYQGDNLMPSGKGKLLIEQHCLECHAFQTKMAGVSRDEEGWSKAVNYMRDVMGYRLTALSADDATVVKGYLNSVFGQDSKLPRDVRDMPEYQNLVRPPFADEAMKIVYVTYELPGPNRMPFSAAPDKDGYFWIPYFSMSNSIGRLDPKAKCRNSACPTKARQPFTPPFPRLTEPCGSPSKVQIASANGTPPQSRSPSIRIPILIPRTAAAASIPCGSMRKEMSGQPGVL